MNELFQRLGQFIKNMLSNMSTPQLFALSILVLLLITSMVWLVSWGQASGMVELVSIAESADNKLAVKQKLDQQNVRYEIRDGGAIYVPREQKDALLIDLAGEGVLSDKTIWTWLMEGTDLTSTYDIREKRFVISLQRSLEKKFSILEGVKSASVTITPASEGKALGFQGDDAKASVLLTLKPNKAIGKQTILGVANITASSVSGLKAKNVSIMDTGGRLYKVPDVESEAGIAQDKDGVEELKEEKLAEKVKNLLAGMVGDSEVYVQARVNKNFSTVDQTTVERSGTIDTESQDSRLTSSGGGGVGGTPDQQPWKGATTVGGGGTTKEERKSNTISTPAKEDTTKKHIPPGDIKDSSIAVVISKKADAKLPTDTQIKDAVSKAAGIDIAKISVSLVEIPTIPPPPPPLEPTLFERADEYAEKYGGQVALGIFALFSLFMIYKVVRQAMPPKDLYTEIAKAREVIGGMSLPEGAGGTAPATSAEKSTRMRSGVREAVIRNPRSVANVLKRWVMSR